MLNKTNIYVGLFLLAAVAIFFVMRNVTGDPFDIPKGGETTSEIISIDEDGQIVKEGPGEEEGSEGEGSITTREIMVTDGEKHTIPLDEVLQGCPSRDCIRSIDDPVFVSVQDAAAWLEADDPGVTFSRGGVDRFYPYQILVRHEIVNDTFPVSETDPTEQRVLITYCPLCLTGVVFDPVAGEERSEFGVSGLLWKSNLVMYDRNTENLWSQVLGEAVIGELAGTKLKTLPSDQILYGNWRDAHPQGEVLSNVHGGGANPYGGSFLDLPSTSLNFTQPTDTRLPFGAFVFGVLVRGDAKAYLVDDVKEKGEIVDTFNGTTFKLIHDTELDVVRIFEVLEDGTEKRVVPVSGFWFSWAEAHPGTELYNN